MQPIKQTPIRLSKPDDCIACPVEVRGLAACAHNALTAFDAMQRGDGDMSRFVRKMEQLRESVRDFQPALDAHFKDRSHSHSSSL